MEEIKEKGQIQKKPFQILSIGPPGILEDCGTAVANVGMILQRNPLTWHDLLKETSLQSHKNVLTL